MGSSGLIVISVICFVKIYGILAGVTLVPGDAYLSSGADVLRLGCFVDELEPGTKISTKWKLNNESLTTGDKYSIDTTGTLTIKNPNSNDTGRFECWLVDKGQEIQGSIVIYPYSVFGHVNKEVELPCLASQNGTAQNISWFTEDGAVSIHGTDSKYQLTNNGSLRILNLTRGDGGEYRCHASNKEGETNTSRIRLLVGNRADVVRIIPEKTQLWLLEDSNLQLDCIYEYTDGQEMETVDFYHDGKLIKDKIDGFKRLVTKKVEDQDGVTKTMLTIMKNGTSQTDQGVYKCELGTSKLTSEINIHIFTLTPKHATLVEGDKPLEIACTVSGIGPTVQYEIEWHHNSENLTEGDKYSMPTNGSLIINKPERSDMGQYTCTFVFFPESATEIHRVTPAPVQVKAGPKIDSHDNNKNMVEGDELELKCKVTGFPLPTITWLKDGVKFNETQRIHFLPYEGVSTGKLQIYSLAFDDQGTYTCFASNMVPPINASAEMKLRVKDKLAALWPFLGIVAEVVILCAIILVYEKRRSKKLAEDDDATDGNNVDNTADHKDVRHRRT